MEHRTIWQSPHNASAELLPDHFDSNAPGGAQLAFWPMHVSD
jgi:hypothetical protein